MITEVVWVLIENIDVASAHRVYVGTLLMMRPTEGDWMTDGKADEEDADEGLAVSVHERREKREERTEKGLYII